MTQHQKWEENEIREASKCAEHEEIARKEARREVLDMVMSIDIPRDGSDSELHQLRFKEKVMQGAKSLGIGLSGNDK